MKNTVIKVMLILGYFVPFVFLAMNEDAVFGTMWFYLVMVVGFGILCFGSIKTRSLWIIILGNILSFVSSSIFARVFQTGKWGFYFTPFSPKQLIIFESVVALIVQLIFFTHNSRKNSAAKKGD